MKLFIDESGSFSADVERTSAVVGLAVPGPVEAILVREFSHLRTAIAGSPAVEVKSSRWPEHSRRELCRILEFCPGACVRGIILDLTQFRGNALDDMRQQLDDGLTSALAGYLSPANRRELDDMAVWHRNLSDPEIIKLYAWANCADQLLRDLAALPVSPAEHPAWRDLQIVLDGPSRTGTMRPGLFFALASRYWLKGWSELSPVTVMGADHPLVEHFGAGGGLDLPRITERMQFADSRDEVGLQVADVAAAIVRRAADSRGSDPEALATYGWLMKSSVERPGVGIGLLTPFSALADTPGIGFEAMIREYDLAQVRRNINPELAMVLMAPGITRELPAVWGAF